MSYYEQIYDEAIGKNGIITSQQALKLGIPSVELVKLARRGKLTRLGHGVYRIDKFFPTMSDPYAIAVALCGEGAYVIGESVLAFYELCPVQTNTIVVGTTNRIRRQLPPTVCLKQFHVEPKLTLMDGIPAQTIPDAILEARNTIETTRLWDAVNVAAMRQLITPDEKELLLKRLKYDTQKAEQLHQFE